MSNTLNLLLNNTLQRNVIIFVVIFGNNSFFVCLWPMKTNNNYSVNIFLAEWNQRKVECNISIQRSVKCLQAGQSPKNILVNMTSENCFCCADLFVIHPIAHSVHVNFTSTKIIHAKSTQITNPYNY